MNLKKGGFCIFTIPNLLRINYFFDPLYYGRFVKRFFKNTKHWDKKKFKLSSLSGSNNYDSYYDRKYTIGELNESLERNKLKIKNIVAFGYGPLTFFDKNILPDHLSIRVSNKLNRMVKITDSILLKTLANRWVFVVEKN